MAQPVESSYQGYIASTHDALLIFECVRRGVMPKITRRLREEERTRLIRSGQVFVFDEKESGIRRWTDGLLWSPSRILWNFLVYRQVEKKTGEKTGITKTTPGTLTPASETTSPLAVFDASAHVAYQDQSNATPFAPFGSFESLPVGQQQDTDLAPDPQSVVASTSDSTMNRLRGFSGSSETLNVWESLSMLEGFGKSGSGSTAQRDANDERSLVGSLTSSFPFAKGGLCKKTISIQIENSTQHLISYYTVEDVRSGRLRTPSSLPEIASLAISPIFLTRTAFRFPPIIIRGADGIPRFAGEETQDTASAQQRRNDQESSGEGTSSGSEAQHFRRQHQTRPHSTQGHVRGKSTSGTTTRNRAMTGGHFGMPGLAGLTTSISQPAIRAPPLPHQVGGTGALETSRRASDVAMRTSRNRFEPYPASAPNSATAGPSNSVMMYASPQHGGLPITASEMGGLSGGGGMSIASTSSAPTTPFSQQPMPMNSQMFPGMASSAAAGQDPLMQAAQYGQISQQNPQHSPQTTQHGQAMVVGPQAAYFGLQAGADGQAIPHPSSALDTSGRRPSQPNALNDDISPRTEQQAVRPSNSSVQLAGRPHSDHGPILHASSQESFRRAIASSGWEPSVPDAYQGPSQTMSGHVNAVVRQTMRPFGSASAVLGSSDEQRPTTGEGWQAVLPGQSPAFGMQGDGFVSPAVPLMPFGPSVGQSWQNMNGMPMDMVASGQAGAQSAPLFSSGSSNQQPPDQPRQGQLADQQQLQRQGHSVPHQFAPAEQWTDGNRRLPSTNAQQSYMLPSGMPVELSGVGWHNSSPDLTQRPHSSSASLPLGQQFQHNQQPGGGWQQQSQQQQRHPQKQRGHSKQTSASGMGSIFLTRPPT